MLPFEIILYISAFVMRVFDSKIFAVEIVNR